jgi:hypothetical protein
MFSTLRSLLISTIKPTEIKANETMMLIGLASMLWVSAESTTPKSNHDATGRDPAIANQSTETHNALEDLGFWS